MRQTAPHRAQMGASTALRWARVLAGLVAVDYLILGVWAYVDQAGFYEEIANFAEINEHFLRDAGALQLGLGLVAVCVAARPRGQAPIMLALAIASGLHAASHLLDLGEGGRPLLDIPVLVTITILCVAAAAAIGKADHEQPDASSRGIAL